MISDPRQTSPARWLPLLLVAAYTLHLAEEIWGGVGFEAWMERAYGMPISATRFAVVNGIAWPIFVVLAVAALRRPAFRWFSVAFGALVALNAALHWLGGAATGSYSPGMVTALLLYVPLGVWALAAGWRDQPQGTFWLAVLGGVAAHALVAVVALA